MSVEPAPHSALGATGPASARVRAWVVACTGLALVVGFAHLQRRSLGHEEAYTWSTVDRSFPALISVLARAEGYQILHSLIEWPTNRISSTIDALRTPSVLAFAAAVPALWLAGRRLFDERTGLLAALLFALNGFALQYAQQSRGYMLATMLCAYAAALLAQYVFAPRRWSRVGWIAVSALAIYAHGFAVLAIAAQVAALWFLPVRRRRDLHWIRNGLLIALCAAPALLAPLLQVNSGEFGYSAKPGIADLRDLVWSMSGRTASAVPVIGLGIVIALAAAARALRNSRHSDDAFRFAMPLLWMIVPSAVLLSGSYLHPIWLDRYVLWSVGAVVLLAAYGLTRIAPKHAIVVAAVFVVAAGLSARGVLKWYREPPYQDYHSAMTELAARVRPGDAIIFSPDEARLSATFYLRNLVDLDRLTPVYPPAPWGTFKTGDQKVKPVTQAVIARALAHPYARLWIVSDAEPGVIPTRINELRAGYSLASDRFYTGPLEVVLLVPRR
jgi:mannosyltransferase